MIIFEIFIIIILIFLNGYFALAEIALLSVKKSRLKLLAQQGNKKAQKALILVRKSPEMLSTIQIAITLIGILAGAFGGISMSKYIQKILVNFDFLIIYSETLSVIFVVLIITYFSLVIGELVPKQMALANSEKLSLKVASTILFFMKITKPLVKLLSISTLKLLKILKIKNSLENTVSEEEIRLLIAEGTENGTFEKSEQKMVENIFHLGNLPIREFITPNNEVVWLDINDSMLTIKEKIKGDERAVFPVYDGSIKNVIGVIEVNDFLIHLLDNGIEKIDLKSLIQPVMIIKDNIPSLVAIDRLKKSFISIALVAHKDTNEILGFISFHDILEAIVGEFQTEQ